MVDGMNLTQIGMGDLLLVYGIGLVHLGLGCGIYKLCERKAMLQGTLGHY